MKTRGPVEKPIGGFDPDPRTAFSTFFGTGFFPKAPATFASALVALLMLLAGAVPLWVRLALLVAVSVLGTFSADHTERRYGADARCIVIDEVAGMLVATLLIPWDGLHLAAAFVLFRVLDVLKPPPAYQLESLPSGMGVMADDLMAGAYAMLLLLLADVLLPFA
jgi:phosphatidylglycerophosphatase A